MNQDVEEFLAAARAAVPPHLIGAVKVRTFGSSAAMADVIIDLIAAGEKTGTFALAAEFDAAPEQAPAVGDLYVVTRFQGPAVLLYRITAIERVPFEGINHDHVQVEGPSARTVEVWRKIHWDYWGGLLRARGREPDMQMPVIFQRFEVLYPRPAARA